MPSHAKSDDRRIRAIRVSMIGLVWLVGLAAGFFSILAAAARYGCGRNDSGLACRTSGSALGVLLVIAVISIVAAVTVMTHDRPARRVVIAGGIGLAALVACLVAASGLLGTV
ncbi:MAG TPA: hypothetical protein VKB75_09230 [Jatrophihabitans sp.]|nr:hypothetical protein [Jatrophihabitans sp.]